MISFESVFPILLWSALGFLILKAIMVTRRHSEGEDALVEGEDALVGWISAIVGAILVVALYFLGGWLSARRGVSLASFFILYIPASIFFARKYGAVIGLYVTTYGEGSRRLADPFGVSEVFLVVLLLVMACLAESVPGIGWLIIAFLLMAVAALAGTSWYGSNSFELWIDDLEVKEEKRSSKERLWKDEDSRFAGILVWALDWVGIAMSYLGLPILLTLMLPEPSFWVWGGCALCLVGFLTPPVYFRVKRSSVLWKVQREYTKLKQAEASGDLQTIVAALDNRHIWKVAKAALERKFAANPSIFDSLLQILMDGQGNWEFVRFLWSTTAKGRYGGGPYKLHPTFAKRLVEVLSVKSIPIEQRADLLYRIIEDKNFFETRMLQERLPELMSDSELMKQLKARHQIELKMKQ